jgi:hypothetical protein
MGHGKDPLPLMVACLRRWSVVWALASPVAVSAQPSDLFECIDLVRPRCEEVGVVLITPDCGREFESFFGRIAWFPLQCVAPITVEIESIALPNTQFPIYVEIVPLGPNHTDVCNVDLGYVVLVVNGDPAPCGGWTNSGLIDITRYVAVGTSYALRLHFFGNPFGYSPGVGCVRVTAQAIQSGVDSGRSWWDVKRLYR